MAKTAEDYLAQQIWEKTKQLAMTAAAYDDLAEKYSALKAKYEPEAPKAEGAQA